MSRESGFAKALMTVSLTFIALMGIYALWAEEITAAFWKTLLTFAILVLLSMAIQWSGKPRDERGRSDDLGY